MTSRFGEIEIPDESSINFPEGVVGFKECSEFVIFDCGDDGVFKWLQSCNKDDVAFVICEAHLIIPEYRIILGQKELDALSAKSVDELITCLILCIPENPHDMTANLLGPIVFNAEKRVGMQLVLINPDYSTKYKVFADPEQETGDKGEKEAEGQAPESKGGK
ncbi:MAG: flagellar assembly protein FliW [Planctomycetota bacterium]|jgi:flagellar assembly factor FliW